MLVYGSPHVQGCGWGGLCGSEAVGRIQAERWSGQGRDPPQKTNKGWGRAQAANTHTRSRWKSLWGRARIRSSPSPPPLLPRPSPTLAHERTCLSGLAAQPDMVMSVVISDLACRSRTWLSGLRVCSKQKRVLRRKERRGHASQHTANTTRVTDVPSKTHRALASQRSTPTPHLRNRRAGSHTNNTTHLPPKMPSTSPETCACAEKPAPTKDGSCHLT
jgi:hypothetical protein